MLFENEGTIFNTDNNKNINLRNIKNKHISVEIIKNKKGALYSPIISGTYSLLLKLSPLPTNFTPKSSLSIRNLIIL